MKMRSASFLAVAALAGCLVGALSAQPPFAGTAVNRAKVFVIQAQRDNEHIASVLAQRCSAELTATASWTGGISALSHGASAASKRAVQQALQSRVGGLETALKKTLAVRARLGDHISRVNRAFSWMHDASMRDVNHATDVLRALGAVLGTHDRLRGPVLDPISFEAHPLRASSPSAGNATAPPTVAINATANVEKDMANAAAFLQMQGPDRYVLPAFLDVSSHVVRATIRRAASRASRAAVAAGEVSDDISESTARSVTEAYRRAVHMYNSALDSWRRLKSDFERERATLTMFRDRLDALIAAKHSTMVALTVQLHDTTAALGAAEPALATAVHHMETHAQVLSQSCRGVKQALQYFTEKRAEVLSDISAAGIVAPPQTDSWTPQPGPATAPAESEPVVEAPSATNSTSSSNSTAPAQPPAATGGAQLDAPEAGSQPEEAVAATGASF